MNEYQTRKAKIILALYWAVPVFFVAMMVFIPFFSGEEMGRAETIFFWLFFAALTIWFFIIIYRIHHMRYLIKNGEITIYGVFKTNTVRISEIEEIKRTPIPFGIRLFGGSLIGGRYFLPGIGRAWVAMTNFEDGVLITTRNKEHYLITPDKPGQFIDFIKSTS